jgi:AraC family ethanolamine operon transcriptional activator
MTRSRVKPDHRARQLQTASMARIERFLDDHREHLTGLQDLCQGTDLALRTVETIIRDRTGMTALTYLLQRRLAFAREALLHPELTTNVTSVAMRFGFLHLGRFASFYQKTYGELPSLTMARALGRDPHDSKIQRDLDSRFD